MPPDPSGPTVLISIRSESGETAGRALHELMRTVNQISSMPSITTVRAEMVPAAGVVDVAELIRVAGKLVDLDRDMTARASTSLPNLIGEFRRALGEDDGRDD